MPTIPEALRAFLLDCQAKNLSPLTVKTYKRRLVHFTDWCVDQGITDVAAITTNHFRQYQASLTSELADTSARGRCIDCKTFLRWCAKEALIAESPAAGLKLPKVVERLPTILSPSQIKRLYLACESDREKAVLLTLLDTGMRAAEFCNLNVGDLDEGVVTIRDGKPRRDRLCYLSERTQRALRLYMRTEGVLRGHLWRAETTNGRLTVSGLAQLLNRMGEREDIHVTPHKIRRTTITMLLKSGTDVFTLMKLSGHKDIESLKPYIRLSNEDAQQAHKSNSPVERLFT